MAWAMLVVVVGATTVAGQCPKMAVSFMATCKDGFKNVPHNALLCMDIDECADVGAVGLCGGNTTCTNTAGSYECACASGFIRNATVGAGWGADEGGGAWCVPKPAGVACPPGLVRVDAQGDAAEGGTVCGPIKRMWLVPAAAYTVGVPTLYPPAVLASWTMNGAEFNTAGQAPKVQEQLVDATMYAQTAIAPTDSAWKWVTLMFIGGNPSGELLGYRKVGTRVTVFLNSQGYFIIIDLPS